jgi:membrane-associated protein
VHHVEAVNILSPQSLLQAYGAAAVLVFMFVETGLLIGFFLPGDSLLFLAGVAASPVAAEIVGGRLSLPLLLVGAPICAFSGAQLGHLLGARCGRRLFRPGRSRLFRAEYVERAEAHFERYGPAKAVVLARLVPIVRTFINPVAGLLEMSAGRFAVWNLVGGVIWTDGILLAGYLPAVKLRDTIGATNIDKYMLPIVAVIVLVSLTPVFLEVRRARRQTGAK